MASLKNNISLLTDRLTDDITHPHAIRLFRKIVYCWFLLNTLILLPAADRFWSQNALVPKIDESIVKSFPLFHLLNTASFAPYYQLFLGLQIVLLIVGIMCIYPRIVSLLIYLITINLDNKAYVILDGGNNLMQIILLYLVLMDPSIPRNKYKSTTLNQVNNSVSNLSFYMVRLQVVMVYLVSGLAKVSGDLWQNGTALYYTLSIDEYSHPIAKKIISNYPFFTVVGSYATLLYQVAFPWLVWNRKLRPYLLGFGTFIHIQISFVMGLFMFGLAIATSYFSFAEDRFAERVLNINRKVAAFLKNYINRRRISAGREVDPA
jgi:hypothetical protein